MKKTGNTAGMADIFGLIGLASAIKAADAILANCSVYNADTGLIIVPDTVDSAEHDDSGAETSDGNWLYGMMTCRMDREEIIRQKEEYGFDSLTELARETFPAPGTGAKNRMGNIPISSKEDLLDAMSEIFVDEPGSWYAENR